MCLLSNIAVRVVDPQRMLIDNCYMDKMYETFFWEAHFVLQLMALFCCFISQYEIESAGTTNEEVVLRLTVFCVYYTLQENI